MGLGTYIKKAFLFHWNLLAFFGGMAFAALSGRPDVAIPLVLAGEVAYLGWLGTHPKFQRFVNAQDAKAERQKNAARSVDELLKALPPADVRRFEALRERCLTLRQIAQELEASHGMGSLSPLEEMQLSDLDRLLWIYLRMLYTREMLNRFFERTDARAIQAEIRRIEQRIEQAPDPASPAGQRIVPTLREGLETSKARLENLNKAREKYELLQAEIENLEAKIQSITELAVNRHDPEFITGQVDLIAQSLRRSEQTMSELQLATGFAPADTDVPSILPRTTARMAPSEFRDDEERPARRSRDDEIRFL